MCVHTLVLKERFGSFHFIGNELFKDIVFGEIGVEDYLVVGQYSQPLEDLDEYFLLDVKFLGV